MAKQDDCSLIVEFPDRQSEMTTVVKISGGDGTNMRSSKIIVRRARQANGRACSRNKCAVAVPEEYRRGGLRCEGQIRLTVFIEITSGHPKRVENCYR